MTTTQALKKYLVPPPTDEQRNALLDATRVPGADFRRIYGLNLMVPLSNVIASRRWGLNPSDSFALVGGYVPNVNAGDRELLIRYFMPQPETVMLFVKSLAENYSLLLPSLLPSCMPPDECLVNAMLSVTLWQWHEALAPCAGSYTKVLEVLRLLREIDELQVWHCFGRR